MTEATRRQFSRKLRAAIDVYVVASGSRYTREQVFEVLTDPDDPEMPIGMLGRLLQGLPPAQFPLEQLPVPMIPVNPRQN